MRYYLLQIINQSGKVVRTWTSHPNGPSGLVDLGAADIEIDCLVAQYSLPKGATNVTVWGPTIADIAQAANFNGMSLALFGGMATGLPLANPSQQGLLLSGTVYQAYGNWIGTEMSLCFNVGALAQTSDNPGNFVLVWRAGTSLAQAIGTMLSTALPNYLQQINISASLQLQHDEVHYCGTLQEMAAMINNLTVGIFGSTYQGVDFTVQGNTVRVYDGTGTQQNPTQLLPTDLVGQPTWLGPNEGQIACVMRGDIHVADYIKMPVGFNAIPGAVQTANPNLQVFPNRITWQGTLIINGLRHLGRFRDADGRSWATIINVSLPGAPAPVPAVS